MPFNTSDKVVPFFGGGQVANPANVIVRTIAPPATVANIVSDQPVGTIYINVTTGNSYMLVQNTFAAGQVWTLLGGAAGAVSTINSLSPTAGNIIIAGTANQITATSAVSTVTLSVPTTFSAPGTIAAATTVTAGTNLVATAGSVTAGTSVTATLGNITATNGNLVLGTAGNKISSTSVASTTTAGANSFGTVALVGGAATVTTTAVTANSLIFLTCQALGTVAFPSSIAVTAKTAATNFVITADDATDTSTIAWMIVN